MKKTKKGGSEPPSLDATNNLIKDLPKHSFEISGKILQEVVIQKVAEKMWERDLL